MIDNKININKKTGRMAQLYLYINNNQLNTALLTKMEIKLGVNFCQGVEKKLLEGSNEYGGD